MQPFQKKPKINRFRRRGLHLKEPTPKFNIDDIAGEFTVIGYLGHSSIHPTKAVRYSGAHHWYSVRCSCGIEEIHTQQQLIDVRRSRTCVECQSKQIKEIDNAD